MKRLLILFAVAAILPLPETGRAASLWDTFLSPPAVTRPMVRWWWFGPGVTEGEIDREIRAMKAGGFGGFEVQPTYPLSPDNPPGLVNLPYMSGPFLAALRHAGETARRETMRIDVTIGSGWPFGGPHIPIDQAASALRMIRVPRSAGRRPERPAIGPGELLLAAFRKGAGGWQRVNPEEEMAPDAQRDELLLFVQGRTGQQVKRPALGAEGFVLDHLSRHAVANHLKTIGDALLTAFPKDAPPQAMFSDSLEAYGSSWTDDLPAQFRRRRGYDLIGYLPALFLDQPESAAVRYDWARTLSELVDENYLAPIDEWATRHGTRFRAQVYGIPPATLSSNAMVALPEGEGADWRSFTSTRWATSAAHIYGRPVVSSETWTWLHAPSFAATPLDMKAEADRHFLQGVNQLIGHGWPYSPPGADEPGWAFYAAAALNDHNPWYPVMADVTRYLARISAMLREGRPDDDVALYVPTEDAFAEMRPDRASVNEAMRDKLPASLIGAILDSGHNFDLIDAKAIMSRGIHYRLLVLPPMQRIDPAAYRAIAAWTARGGKLIAVERTPSLAGGLLDARLATTEVERLSQQLFPRMAGLVKPSSLGNAIHRLIGSEVAFDQPAPQLGFIRRKLSGGDIYFLANTGNTPFIARARFAGDRGDGQWWDPITGRRWAAGAGKIPISLAAYESRLLVFGTGQAPETRVPATWPRTDISAGWSLRFGKDSPQPAGALHSWTDRPQTRFYSGSATYSRTLRISAPMAASGVAIDFGAGQPQPAAAGTTQGMKALFDAPVREAAIVTVNGTRAGSLWAPPYRLDISALVRPGTNRIDVTVMNSALNRMAAVPLPDYRLLTARYGDRFQMQGLDQIVPAPSGLLGPISLKRR